MLRGSHMKIVGIEVRNVGMGRDGKYEVRVLDAWQPTTRAEIAKQQRQGTSIHWNPKGEHR